jgi:hypothetical protein
MHLRRKNSPIISRNHPPHHYQILKQFHIWPVFVKAQTPLLVGPKYAK